MDIEPELHIGSEIDLARRLLVRAVADVGPVGLAGGGRFARAYRADSPSKGPLILRLNATQSYAVDVRMQAYAGPALPVPEVVALGFDEGVHWCVSVRCPGVLVSELPSLDIPAVTAQICDVLDALAAVDLGGTTGFGSVGEDGDGGYDSWPAYVRESAFAQNGVDLGALLPGASDRDRAFVAACRSRAEELHSVLPDVRVLLHGDFTAANLIHDGTRITGVIDWAALRYGDPLFDVAWFDLQYPQFGLPAEYLSRHRPPHAAERLEYYRLISAAFIVGFLGRLGDAAELERCHDTWSGWFATHT